MNTRNNERPWTLITPETLPPEGVEVEVYFTNLDRIGHRHGHQWFHPHGRSLNTPLSWRHKAEDRPAPPPDAAKVETVGWWCKYCSVFVPGDQVTFQETHDIRAGGCGHPVDEERPAHLSTVTEGPTDNEILTAMYGEPDEAVVAMKKLYAPVIARLKNEGDFPKSQADFFKAYERTSKGELREAHAEAAKWKEEAERITIGYGEACRGITWAEQDHDKTKSELTAAREQIAAMTEKGMHGASGMCCSIRERQREQIERLTKEVKAHETMDKGIEAVCADRDRIKGELESALRREQDQIILRRVNIEQMEVLKSAPKDWPTVEEVRRVWFAASNDWGQDMLDLFTARHNAIVAERDAKLTEAGKLIAEAGSVLISPGGPRLLTHPAGRLLRHS